MRESVFCHFAKIGKKIFFCQYIMTVFKLKLDDDDDEDDDDEQDNEDNLV